MTSSSVGRAIVTGASSGIGAVYADRLAQRGMPLLLVARRAGRLEALARQLLDAYPIEVETLVADLETAEGVSAVEHAISASPLSMLVNNAGAGGLGPMSSASADGLERTMKLNIVALTRLSHAALHHFAARKSGTLINISSVMAFSPSAAGAVYSGSKAYVLNFTRSLALEFAQTDVRIQAVLPGPIRTEFFTSQGLSDAVFPESTYLSAEQLVDAALAGLDRGESETIPSLLNFDTWTTLEAARTQFMAEIGS